MATPKANAHIAKAMPFAPALHAAIRAGTKTVTRRMINPQPTNRLIQSSEDGNWYDADCIKPGKLVKCPYKVGQVVACVTQWGTTIEVDHLLPTQLPEQGHAWSWQGDSGMYDGKTRPGRFLPRSMYHLAPLRRVVSIRAERLQEITEEDAVREGIERVSQMGAMRAFGWKDYSGGPGFFNPRKSFETLIDSIQGQGVWASNPHVLVIELEEVK